MKHLLQKCQTAQSAEWDLQKSIQGLQTHAFICMEYTSAAICKEAQPNRMRPYLYLIPELVTIMKAGISALYPDRCDACSTALSGRTCSARWRW